MGPLAGIRVVEIASIGPGPFCATLLSDLGAEVIRVDRASEVSAPVDDFKPIDFMHRRGRRSVAVDLKSPAGAEVVLQLVERADALLEGSRPGVAERLGIGPDICLARNPRLIYARLTGWGQDGPMAQVPGHDINYVALTGVLSTIGPRDGRPIPPLNMIGDFAGGGLMAALGIVCGILEASRSGRGQVIDSAMVDGVAMIGSMVHGFQQVGSWSDSRESNRHDGGAPFYGAYETADGKYVAIAANEPKFYSVMIAALGLSADELPAQLDRAHWPETRERFAAAFKTRTQAEWIDVMAPLDTCFSPVLSLAEAREHPHAAARNAYVEVDGIQAAAPSPRFSRTPARVAGPAAQPGEHTEAVLHDWGFSAEQLTQLEQQRVIVQQPPRPSSTDHSPEAMLSTQ